MMKINFNINTRMLVYLLSGSALIYILSLGVVIYQTIQSTRTDTYKIVEQTAAERANLIKAAMDADFKAIEVMADVGMTFSKENFEEWEKIFLAQQKQVLERNKHYLSVATSFELRFIDSSWYEKYGRLMKGYYRENGEIKLFHAKRNLDGDDLNSNYYTIKSNVINWISDPELFSYTGKDEDAILNTNISVPIMRNNEFAGLAGADIDMSFFQKITDSIRLYSGSYSFILSNNNTVVAHPNSKWVGKHFDEVDSVIAAEHNIIERIQRGDTFTFLHPDTTINEELHYTFTPIYLEGTQKYWSLAIAIPNSVILEKTTGFFRTGLTIGILGIIIMALIIIILARSISRPIINTTNILKDLARGQFDRDNMLKIKTNDELSVMGESVNQLTLGLYRTTEFASEVGKGNYDSEFELLSDDDMLGSALIGMRDNLIKAKEEEARRKKEEDIRRWSADGQAILNDLLRQAKDFEELSYSILSQIIKYIDGAMGAIYVLNDNDEKDVYFEMLTTVAYEREKLMRAKVKPEEGLVGRCAHEKLTIYLKEIPENYVKVTSGLGESNPRSLLLIPLSVNENVLGVLELVSFNEFEQYQIEFLEKAGENIASDLSASKINKRTEILLKQSQEQAEELAQQEEEMRQNMEEIQATQESLKESQAKTQMIFDNVVDAIVTIDSRGIIELWNPAAEKLFGYSPKEAIGQNIKLIMYGEDAREHDNYLERYMNTGQRHVLGKSREVMGMNKSGKKFHVELRLEEGRLGNETKFIGVLRDIDNKKKAEEELRSKMEEMQQINKISKASKAEMELLVNGVKQVSLYVEYNMDRKIIEINDNFLKLLDTQREDMLGVKQGAFETDPDKKKEFDKLWLDLNNGKTRKIIQHIMAKDKNLYFSEVYIPVKDEKGKVYKVINLAIDITETIRQKKN
jgi:methyl-accepting chemotaxis protein